MPDPDEDLCGPDSDPGYSEPAEDEPAPSEPSEDPDTDED